MFHILDGMRMRERWWWNGRWGRLARHDVKVYRDGGRWSVEFVQGGVEGRVRLFDDLDRAGAEAQASELMMGQDDWQDMMPPRDPVGDDP